MNETENHNENGAMSFQPGLKMRLRMRLFPDRYCEFPETGDKPMKDCIHTRAIVVLSRIDRLRVLLTGRASVTTKTVLVEDGSAVTNTVFQPEPWNCLADDRREWDQLAARQKGAA